MTGGMLPRRCRSRLGGAWRRPAMGVGRLFMMRRRCCRARQPWREPPFLAARFFARLFRSRHFFAAFLAAFLADFFTAFLADFFADFFADFLTAFLADFFFAARSFLAFFAFLPFFFFAFSHRRPPVALSRVYRAVQAVFLARACRVRSIPAAGRPSPNREAQSCAPQELTYRWQSAPCTRYCPQQSCPA